MAVRRKEVGNDMTRGQPLARDEGLGEIHRPVPAVPELVTQDVRFEMLAELTTLRSLPHGLMGTRHRLEAWMGRNGDRHS